MSTFWSDLRHGARLLLRAPGFTAVAVAALAIGIGANTAIFSVVHTLLLKPLPYHDADRLAVIWEHNIPRDRKTNVVSPGNFIHWREMQQTFEDIAAVGFTFGVTLTGDGRARAAADAVGDGAVLPVLGVQPALGRPFTVDEDKSGSRVAVISERLWRRRFNGDAGDAAAAGHVRGETHYRRRRHAAAASRSSTRAWTSGCRSASPPPRGRRAAGGSASSAASNPGSRSNARSRTWTRVHAELGRLFPDFNTGWTARVVPLRSS